MLAQNVPENSKMLRTRRCWRFWVFAPLCGGSCRHRTGLQVTCAGWTSLCQVVCLRRPPGPPSCLLSPPGPPSWDRQGANSGSLGALGLGEGGGQTKEAAVSRDLREKETPCCRPPLPRNLST